MNLLTKKLNENKDVDVLIFYLAKIGVKKTLEYYSVDKMASDALKLYKFQKRTPEASLLVKIFVKIVDKQRIPWQNQLANRRRFFFFDKIKGLCVLSSGRGRM